MNFPKERPDWLKGRGYLHITPKIDMGKRAYEFFSKVSNPKFVATHAFFPLIHSVIRERKYKKHPENSSNRAHSHFYKGKYKSSAKIRPLHYATHIDALIFGYYADTLTQLYEANLQQHPGLNNCVIAYRSIPVDETKNAKGKSTINFAYETFKAIAQRSEEEYMVLMFDIKSFFSELDHKLLKTAWCDLLRVSVLPKDHYNVFKATTKFRYILKDDLRLKTNNGRRKSGFDERKLAHIRKVHGKECFFESLEDFRDAIATKQIKVYKKPFVKKDLITGLKTPVGIPQGLPISAILANLYLYKFDIAVLQKVVHGMGGFYRRYSDDILIVCKKDQSTEIEHFIKGEIGKSKVDISDEKTEKYLFRNHRIGANGDKTASFKIMKDGSIIAKPLTYLGFEFNGENILIKSANLAKFYRRMIYATKRKAIMAVKIAETLGTEPVIYKGRLKRLYGELKLGTVKQFNKSKKLVRHPDGFYRYSSRKSLPKKTSNYFSYVRRASKIMNKSGISAQLRKHRTIFNIAIGKQLERAKQRNGIDKHTQDI